MRLSPDDFSQAIEMRERESAISEIQNKEEKSGPGYSHCKDCGEEIEQERRAIRGVVRCIFCQEQFERDQNRCRR